MSIQTYGKFQLIKKLASGGMAEVFYARQQGIEGFSKEMVVKRILPHLAEDPEFVEMFKHEAVIAARFNHPNIAQVYEFAAEAGHYFIAMEFIHGEDLGRVMRKAWSTNQWVARPLAIRIVANAAEGLHYAHTKADEHGRPLKVVHRDISPQNILISFDGSVKVVDFGIAKAADQANLTKSGAIKGKFAYMAPEQAAGKPLDHRVDVFALGLVLYELLTGVRPLKRDTELGTLQAALECAIEPPSAVADVPAELDPVVMRALAKTPDDRYRDARQFQMELEEILVHQRWVASSVQISELMQTLFADRLDEEARAGAHLPHSAESQMSRLPSIPGPELRTDPAAQRSSVSGSHPTWEAPPAQREGTQRATPRSLSRSNAQRIDLPPAAPDVPEWEAPPATVAPRRRTVETRAAAADLSRRLAPSTAVRRPTRDVPRTRAGLDEPPPAPRSGSGARRPRRIVRCGSRGDPDGGGAPPALPFARGPGPSPRPRAGVRGRGSAADEPAPPPTPRRRTSLASVPAQGAPRRRTVSRPMRAVPSAADEEDEDTSGTAPLSANALDPEALLQRAEARRRQFQRLATIGFVIATVLVVFIFRKPLVETLSSTASERNKAVFIEVQSNLAVDVWVEHPPEEGNSETRRKLGTGRALPVTEGAHLGDTIVLESPQLGARWSTKLEYGEPGTVIPIKHEFMTGKLRLNVSPRPMSSVMVFLNEQEHGRVPGPIELYEGAKTLELRSKAFREPKFIEVDIKPNSVLELPVDVRDVLNN